MFEKRVTCLKVAPIPKKARYVLYWMQIAKRAEFNHGLNFAIAKANELKLPLVVYEGLRFDYPYACDRIHQFILQNSIELTVRFNRRGIRYLFHYERNKKERTPMVMNLCRRAALLVSDDFPAFIIQRHNSRVAEYIEIPFFVVDSNGVVPLNELTKQEYAARTIRPKIQRLLPFYLRPIREETVEKDSLGLKVDCEERDVRDNEIEKIVASCDINHSVPPSPYFKGGLVEACRHLSDFLQKKLETYSHDRNDPTICGTSNLSPYLHFGILSSLQVALEAKAAHTSQNSTESFLEELIVRRELSFNFTKFAYNFESLLSLPRWAQETLASHAKDKREYVYSLREFEMARTHDPVWNACQKELLVVGKIHGYMRMYWGKKIIQWSHSPAQALEIMIHLNNQYALDGRDPNSWTGILWCFGLHDRPWGRRPVFGTVRFMSEDGLKRKFDPQGYIDRVAGMTGGD